MGSGLLETEDYHSLNFKKKKINWPPGAIYLTETDNIYIYIIADIIIIAAEKKQGEKSE